MILINIKNRIKIQILQGPTAINITIDVENENIKTFTPLNENKKITSENITSYISHIFLEL